MTKQQNRLASLKAKMKETGTDLVAIGPSSHMEWVLGFRTHADERPCLLLITQSSEAFLMPALNAEGTRERCDIPFFPWSDDEGPAQAIKKALEHLDGETIRTVVLDETMRADFAYTLTRALPNEINVEFTEKTVGHLRMIKDADDLELIQASALIDDQAILTAFDFIKPGMTESQVAAQIREYFQSQGATPAFWIVGSGPNGAFPHHSVSERVIQTGDAIVIDIGARKNGFPSDITRMAVIGDPSEEYKKVHAIVEKAVQAALLAAKPGVPAKAVDAAARGVITDAGYGEYFVHRTGHGLGIDGHERPFITATNDIILEEGMVFSIEPGIYLPGKFGVRLEEIVALTKEGPRVFSALPRDYHIIKI
ncbi:M24 family metallopeptidase [Cohaesibacter marisflavi]|uniref:M24 family metallopeptidase n=1 Tax=Cohaesibacter marisflavi TaxID=655353 RepID=UPI0029C6DD67|nr:Xaa-Pro peptidase family protein [Cohaesibacter marisflavi]